MKYDIILELKAKGIESLNENNCIRSIFKNIIAKNVIVPINEEKRDCYVTLDDNQKISMYLNKDFVELNSSELFKCPNGSTISYSLKGNSKKNSDESIKYTTDYEIGILHNDGYYVIKGDEQGKLSILYYDVAAIAYYQKRQGVSTFANPRKADLDYFGILPDSADIIQLTSNELIEVFNNLLANPNDFLENTIQMTKSKKTIKK